MTKFEWPEPIPGFSCVKMKQEIQAQIYRETKGMTDEEVREYVRQGAERFDADMEQRRAKIVEQQTVEV